MKKKIKKAFTLVELLVVIAILAILATVSIIGYNSFTKKAKVSNDTALVSQLNTLLKADSMVNGDAKTPTDALKITSEAGYDVEKLTPTTNDYEIIWNQKTNQFALLDENDNVVYGEKSTDEYKNWKFVSEYNSPTNYSVYLKGTYFTTVPTIHAGIDVGNNENITTINYNNDVKKDDVVIRTNGGTLNVDASKDAISHYGNIVSVNVNSIASESYHVYANVIGTIIVKSGHVKVENNSNVNSIIVEKGTDETLPSSLTLSSGSKVGTIVINNENSVVKAEENADVKTVAPGVGVTIDSSKVTGVNISSNEIDSSNTINYSGGLGTKDNPYLISNVDQLLYVNNNTVSGTAKSLAYLKIINDIDLRDVEPQSFNISGLPCKFYLGRSGNTYGYIYFVSIDGDNHNIYLKKDASLIGDIRNSTLKNLKVHMEGEASIACVAAPSSATIENVSIYSDTKLSYDRNSSIFVGLMTTTSTSTLTIKNCKNYANVEGTSAITGYNGLFVGAINCSKWRGGGNAKILVNGFENYGSLKSGKISAVGNVYGNGTNLYFDIKNIKNDGEICSFYAPLNQYAACIDSKSKFSSVRINDLTKTANDKFLNNYRISSSDETMKISENADKTFTITKSSEANVSYYVVSIGVYTNYKKSTTTGTDIYTIYEKISADKFVGDTFTTSLKNYGFITYQDGMTVKTFTSSDTEISHSTRSNNSNVEVVETNGEVCYVVNIKYESVSGIKYASNSMITITAYAEDGTAISSIYLSK